MDISDLPSLNACLNALSALLLSFGFAFIRQGKKAAHRNCMISAFCTSTLFLISYVVYHYYARRTVFADPAWFRPIYLFILLTHTVLAVVILPMVLLTFFRALKGRFEMHRRIARWTLPLWMYVSMTGVLIYVILYVVFPQR
jgi:putative membrane protein